MTLMGPLLWWTRAQVMALRAEWDEAEAALRAGYAGPRDYEMARVPSCLAAAQVAEARADYAAVVVALEPLRQPWARGWVDEPGAWPWPDAYANALVNEGRHQEADEFLRPFEERAAARGHRTAAARLGYARGRLQGAQGDLVAAMRSFDAALAVLADTPLRYDRARVNFAYGLTLRRAGKRREADTVIGTARDIYAALGATSYVARCERELQGRGREGRPQPGSAGRRADPAGGDRRGPGGPRALEQGGRLRALRLGQDRAVPPDPDLREARPEVPHRAGRGPRLRCWLSPGAARRRPTRQGPHPCRCGWSAPRRARPRASRGPGTPATRRCRRAGCRSR